ncbi:hypothetical protein VTK26DRAFT_6601 [Humicola hyalothermophila]
MPCLRGVVVSLVTKPDDEQIPEYPHPEGMSARILTDSEPDNDPSVCSNGTPNRPRGHAVHPKAGPTVSVYIPSIPGTRFAINYRINTAPVAPCKFVFFSLYINARPVAAWGIDPEVRPNGNVVKSLWAPGSQYQNQVGFEGRNFVFLPGEERKSIAEDGGLIEVQVFRAKERRARAPKLETFRFHENYGIASPSIGLLDRPQDAHFYDWHLLDAKDSPFASFRFHYRSWKNLKQLNLIPATELEFLHKSSPKALKDVANLDRDQEGLNHTSGDLISQSQCSNDEVFQERLDKPGAVPNQNKPQYFLKSPLELFPACSSGPRIPQPSKALRDGYRESYLQRPLPELPVEAPPSLRRRSSVTSVLSTTLSITPSLQQYVEEGSLNPDEMEVGVAELVRMTPSASALNLTSVDDLSTFQRTISGEEYSVSDYDTSPRSTDDSSPLSDVTTTPNHNSKRNGNKNKSLLSPSRYLPMTGSGLERGLKAFFTPPKPPRAGMTAARILRRRSKSFRQSRPALGRLEQEDPSSSSRLPSSMTPASSSSLSLSTVVLTESAWLSRSPSPARTRVAGMEARSWGRSRSRRAGKEEDEEEEEEVVATL